MLDSQKGSDDSAKLWFGILDRLVQSQVQRIVMHYPGVVILPIFSKEMCVHVLQGLAGLHRLRSTLAAAPVLFTNAVVTVAAKSVE